jgi:hypothetical protein
MASATVHDRFGGGRAGEARDAELRRERGRPELAEREPRHEPDEARDERGVGATAERNHEALRAALPQVIEQSEREGASELLVLELGRALPSLGRDAARHGLGARQREIRVHLGAFFDGDVRRVSGDPALLGRAELEIDDRAGELEIRERKATRPRDELPARRDQRVAVVDGAPRFVSEQVRVHVGDAERA